MDSGCENDPRQTFRQKCASRLTILDLRVTSRPFLIRIGPTHNLREAAMKTIRFVAVLFALFVFALSASAATLVVLNKSEHTASLIDPESGKTLAKLPVGRGPHEVIVSIDGRTAYVSNFGPYGICPAGDTMCKTQIGRAHV